MEYIVGNEEILTLIRKWQTIKDPELQYKVVDKMEYMIKVKIKRYRDTDFYEDLLQEGRLGIIIAMHKFDECRSDNFFHFSHWYIRNAIRYCVNQNINKETPVPYIYKTIGIKDINDKIEDLEKINIIFDHLEELPVAHREMICLKYGFYERAHSFREIGDIFSLSKQRIHQITDNFVKMISRDKRVAEFNREV